MKGWGEGSGDRQVTQSSSGSNTHAYHSSEVPFLEAFVSSSGKAAGMCAPGSRVWVK